MAKVKKKRKKRRVRKSSKLKIWSLIFMYLTTFALITSSVLNILDIKNPLYVNVTKMQNIMILILSLTYLIFIIISNVGIKTINPIMFINSGFLAFLVTISFKFILKGCIISIVIVILDLFYLCAIYENSERSE